MDKYAVDIDKVLNDFEYSELTDQYSGTNLSTPRPHDTYNKFKNTPSKHTISNVFQSLDEYLNTDVGGVKNVPVLAPSSIGSVGLNRTQVEEGRPVYVLGKQGEPVVEEVSGIVPGLKLLDVDSHGGGERKLDGVGSVVTCGVELEESSCSEDERVDAQLQEIQGELLQPHTQDHAELTCGVVDQSLEVAAQVSGSVAQPVVEIGRAEASVGVIEPHERTSLPLGHNEEFREGSQSLGHVEELREATDSPAGVADLLSELRNASSERRNEASEVTHQSRESINEFSEAANKSSEPVKHDIQSTNVEHASESLEPTYQRPEPTQQPPVLMYHPPESTNQPPASTTQSLASTTQHPAPTTQPPAPTIQLPAPATQSPASTTLLPASTTQLPAPTHHPQLTSESAVIGFDDSSSLNDTELNRYLDELEEEYKTEQQLPSGDEPHELPITEEPSNDDKSSNSRPNSLDIKNQLQIDLVGEPGSTPYNNIYVSDTLKTPQESDTESSSSTTPGFSDASSESNISTASTESVTDSLPPGKQPEPTESSSDKFYDASSAPCDIPEDAASNPGEPTEAGLVTAGGDAGASAHEEPVYEELQHELEPKTEQESWLGKQAPLWIPDSEALNCLHCDTKFTVIKRRHHCRACGLVLCSKCCNMKYRLEYLETEARVCLKCYDILNRDTNSSSGSELSPSLTNSPNRQAQPNPNNPMEYCSMVPPLQQVGDVSQNPPSVMVPVGVLKRKGSSKSRTNKSVMFCDGIRPGSELTNLDNDFNYQESRSSHSKKGSPPPPKVNRNTPTLDPITKSFIPNAEEALPPTVTIFKSDISYTECSNNPSTVEMLRNESLTFAIQTNLHVHVKIINMECCINKSAWCFSTEGMIAVGQDEVVLLLEVIENEKMVPKDVFYHINSVYAEAQKGSSITEYGISLHTTSSFLESKSHIGFLYIRPTFQCLQNVIIPKEPYLIGILIHRWEMPWAKIFPLRLVLRLGAEYRYYPSPIISTRHRESVFVEIGHTIINLLADFRNFSYTLPNIRGLTIHMEEKNTTITIPSNRYEQVMKSMNNSSDHILAFGGNFSTQADSHLVCIQDTHGNNENTYTTHAINIHNRPRKITGASFVVFNGALKSSSGLTAKSSIVEDGLMIQIPPEHMVQIRESLRNMKNHTIQCGCINATSDETVNIIWGENDINFNMGIQSPIDNQDLNGIPSIRVHNGKDYVCNSGNRMIRWTEVFILQNGDDNIREQDVDFSKLSENISKATCQALVKYLDLLSSNNFYKIGVRTTLHIENVSYSAGSNGIKLPPIYMKSLDNELIPVLHRITSNNLGENAIILELIFRILNI